MTLQNISDITELTDFMKLSDLTKPSDLTELTVPYTICRLEAGPCIVGDEKSDPQLMQYLDAVKRQEKGQFFTVSAQSQ